MFVRKTPRCRTREQGNGVNYQFYNYTLTTDNAQVKTHWADLYKCVTRANIILDQIDDIPFKDEVVKNQKKAEMYFCVD